MWVRISVLAVWYVRTTSGLREQATATLRARRGVRRLSCARRQGAASCLLPSSRASAASATKSWIASVSSEVCARALVARPSAGAALEHPLPPCRPAGHLRGGRGSAVGARHLARRRAGLRPFRAWAEAGSVGRLSGHRDSAPSSTHRLAHVTQPFCALSLCWLVTSSARSEAPRPPQRGSPITAHRNPVSKGCVPGSVHSF